MPLSRDYAEMEDRKFRIALRKITDHLVRVMRKDLAYSASEIQEMINILAKEDKEVAEVAKRVYFPLSVKYGTIIPLHLPSGIYYAIKE